MTRRDALKLLGAAPATTQAAKRPPNFIFVFCDDLGWGDLPAYGHRNVNAHGGWIVRGELKTPHIDRMAKEGTLFTQFYVASAVCSPSRAAVMTGKFPGEVGIHDYLASEELNRRRGCVNYLDRNPDCHSPVAARGLRYRTLWEMAPWRAFWSSTATGIRHRSV